jgi:predicted dehydrogenase
MINKILIIGFGSIGKRHFKYLKNRFPEAIVKVLKTKNSKNHTELSKNSFLPENKISKFIPDLTVISNPSSLHLFYAKKALDVRSNIFIEKPLTDKNISMKNFIKQIELSKIHVLVGYNLRFLETLIELKRLIDNQILGRIYSVNCEAGQYLPEWRTLNYEKTVSASNELGGGVVLELSHEIDYLNWIFGEISWVNSHMAKISKLKIDVEDSASFMMGTKLDNPAIINLNLDFIRRNKTREMTIIGEKSSLRWQAEPSIIQKWNLEKQNWENIFISNQKISDTYEIQWEYFFKKIFKNHHSTKSLNDSLKTMKIIKAAKKSSSLSGKRISIND